MGKGGSGINNWETEGCMHIGIEKYFGRINSKLGFHTKRKSCGSTKEYPFFFRCALITIIQKQGGYG